MKVLILCGGKGTRLGSDTPKPLTEIGGRPILWHIIERYRAAGFYEFILLLGHKQIEFKRWFRDLSLYDDIINGEYARSTWSDRRVSLIDTGEDSGTAERIYAVRHFLDDSPFHLTYGDGLSNIDLNALATFHKSSQKSVTVSAVRPPGRFGILEEENGIAMHFGEKQCGSGWINGGFFVMNRSFVETLAGAKYLEFGPLQNLVADKNLAVFKHEGFWQCMDTPRDHEYLCDLWKKGHAPWIS